MNVIYDFPKKTAYGKMMPKSKIYQYASPGIRVKELFVREVDKIIWSYKLSPQTLNLSASGFVKEIQVITIYLKNAASQESLWFSQLVWQQFLKFAMLLKF